VSVITINRFGFFNKHDDSASPREYPKWLNAEMPRNNNFDNCNFFKKDGYFEFCLELHSLDDNDVVHNLGISKIDQLIWKKIFFNIETTPFNHIFFLDEYYPIWRHYTKIYWEECQKIPKFRIIQYGGHNRKFMQTLPDKETLGIEFIACAIEQYEKFFKYANSQEIFFNIFQELAFESGGIPSKFREGLSKKFPPMLYAKILRIGFNTEATDDILKSAMSFIYNYKAKPILKDSEIESYRYSHPEVISRWLLLFSYHTAIRHVIDSDYKWNYFWNNGEEVLLYTTLLAKKYRPNYVPPIWNKRYYNKINELK
jgi:hypothetical protein